MANAREKMEAVRPNRDYFSLPILLLTAASVVPFAWLGGEVAFALGVHPILGMLPAIAGPCVIAGLLFLKQKKEVELRNKEIQRIGWSYKQEETARRLAAMKETNLKADK